VLGKAAEGQGPVKSRNPETVFHERAEFEAVWTGASCWMTGALRSGPSRDSTSTGLSRDYKYAGSQRGAVASFFLQIFALVTQCFPGRDRQGLVHRS